MKWLPLFARRYASTLLSLLLVVALGGIWWHGYQTGMDRERFAQTEAMAALRTESEALADELEAERTKRRAGTRVEVRYVDRATDPSGCLDAPVLDDRMFGTLGGVPGG